MSVLHGYAITTIRSRNIVWIPPSFTNWGFFKKAVRKCRGTSSWQQLCCWVPGEQAAYAFWKMSLMHPGRMSGSHHLFRQFSYSIPTDTKRNLKRFVSTISGSHLAWLLAYGLRTVLSVLKEFFQKNCKLQIRRPWPFPQGLAVLLWSNWSQQFCGDLSCFLVGEEEEPQPIPTRIFSMAPLPVAESSDKLSISSSP